MGGYLRDKKIFIFEEEVWSKHNSDREHFQIQKAKNREHF